MASRTAAVKLIAGIVRLMMSRLTDTRRPTAARLNALTPMSTAITRADESRIFEPSRMPGPFALPYASHQDRRRRRLSDPGKTSSRIRDIGLETPMASTRGKTGAASQIPEIQELPARQEFCRWQFSRRTVELRSGKAILRLERA